MLARSLLAFGIIFMAASLLAQDTLMVVYGTVRNYATREPVAAALVATFDIQDPDQPMLKYTSDAGRYEVDLIEEKSYRIVFFAEGYYPKSLEIALKGPSPEEWIGGYGMDVQILLLPVVEGMDFGADGEPIGKARFIPDSGYFEWDLAYTEAYAARHAEAMKVYRALLGLKD